MSEQLTFDAIAAADIPEARYPLAAAWRDENPEAFDLVVSWARTDHDSGRDCSMQLYIELLRRPELRPAGFTRNGSIYLVNHNIRSELARYIVAKHPYLRFRFRDASCDPPQAQNATPRAGGAPRA